MNYTFTTDREESKNLSFYQGVKKGIPIALGYISVSFTFGLLAVKGGIPLWIAVAISTTNLTSAGQFAGTTLILAQASYAEIALTTFVINIRYMLMSLSLSQKIVPMSLFKRCTIAFGVTDEVFSVASLEQEELSYPFMMGLISLPFIGWSLGTFLGGALTSRLPHSLQSSMGIALYGMFTALIIPEIKKSKNAFIVVLIAVITSCMFKWVPVINSLSGGWVIIIATLLACAAGAYFFPREDI